MKDDFVFRADDTAFKKLMDSLQSVPRTQNLLRLANSLGAIVAGGAAISLFEGDKGGRYRAARDLDLWFPNQEVLDTFIASTKLMDNITCKKSFGGHAIDITTKEYGPDLQVIAFRVGDPVDIISEFDFLNCAVAFNSEGFWYHKDVPELLTSKKLMLQNDNSAFFVSRVYKYLMKGFHTLDSIIQDKLYENLSSIADKAIQAAEGLDIDSDRNLQEHDIEYKPIHEAICKSASVLGRFVSFNRNLRQPIGSNRDTPPVRIEVFRADQKERLTEKLNKIIELRTSIKDARIKTYNLPYGYCQGQSDSEERTVDAFLELI